VKTTKSVELDHAFVTCALGAPEADAMVKLGFVEASSNAHPGFDIPRLTLRALCRANALAKSFPTVVPRSIWVLAHTPSLNMYWNSSGS
jgi:hypothetical protein